MLQLFLTKIFPYYAHIMLNSFKCIPIMLKIMLA